MLSLLLPLVFSSPAAAQAVAAVPPGVGAVTVMVCEEAQGCADGWQAMADHCAGQGIPLLDFEAVAAAGPGGGDARVAWQEAWSLAREQPRLDPLEAALLALRDLPQTVSEDELFQLWMLLASARMDAGMLQQAEQALQAAAALSTGRVHDLPPVSPDTLDRYLAVASMQRAATQLRIDADNPASVAFVDGRQVGAVPVTVELLPGWHRVTVERPGRRTAWVGEVQAAAGRSLSVLAEVSDDDSAAVLEAAVVAGIRGSATPPEVSRQLADWAEDNGLGTVRFVSVGRPEAAGRVPEERLQTDQGTLDVRALWLDVGSARMHRRGPGPATLRARAAPDRFTMGLQLGYARLQQTLPSGSDPHDHLAMQIVARVLLSDQASVDARLGLWRSAQPYYLYDDWLASEVVPVALGLRWAPGSSGVYLGAHGLAIVPLAVGGQGFLGWEWRPTNRWRVGLEGQGGYVDKGAIYGGGLSVAFAG